MFTPHTSQAPVALGVISLGDHARVRACLADLIAHESRTAFNVIWVINASEVERPTAIPDGPDGVLVMLLDTNLGWSGGLHVARSQAAGSHFAWVQDDVRLEAGWLDAMIDASHETPEVGVFGSIICNGAGVPTGVQGGYTPPGLPVQDWNSTNTPPEASPGTVASARAWVTSGGLFTRLSVWDEVGGPDPGLWPLNHVDKDYCTHARAHGHGVALVPGARVRHDRHATGAMSLRYFTGSRYGEILDRRWSAAISQMGPVDAKAVEHACSPWRDAGLAGAVKAAQEAATRLLVPYVKWSEDAFATQQAAALADQEARSTALHARDLADQEAALVANHSRQLAAISRTVSWRVTAPLRAVRRAFRRR